MALEKSREESKHDAPYLAFSPQTHISNGSENNDQQGTRMFGLMFHPRKVTSNRPAAEATMKASHLVRMEPAEDSRPPTLVMTTSPAAASRDPAAHAPGLDPARDG